MSKIQEAISQIEQLNSLNQRDQWVNAINPLVKLSLTIIYIVTVVSFDRYMINGLLVMVIFPLFMFIIGDLSIKDCIYRLRHILPVVCIVGIFNPLFDREIVYYTQSGLGISGGWLSMVSLLIKGVLTVLSAYLLVATTSIEDICYALSRIHMPKIIVSIILLIYRYLFLMFREAEKVTIAYKLRAPGQKGIHISAWGSLVGQMLLRSMDRATYVYESMELRGFTGTFPGSKKLRIKISDICFLLIWIGIFYLIRHTNLVDIIGGMFV